MYILYIDESEDPNSIGQANNHFVLGGVAVFEGEIYNLSLQMEKVQSDFFPEIAVPLEFHAQHIYKGKDRWRREPEEKRQQFMEAVYHVISRNRFPNLVLFATAVHVSYPSTSEQVLDDAFEDICQRFNTFLVRQFNLGYPSKGLLVLDRSGRERRYRALLSRFRTQGTKYGYLGNVVDIPYFADSHHTRMLQLADFCAYAVFLHYEHRDSDHFQTILPRFDRRSPRSGPDGLKHLIDMRIGCRCVACSRR